MTEDISYGASGGQTEDLSQYKGEDGIYKRWIKELDLVMNSKQQAAYEKTGEKVVKIYRNYSGQAIYDSQMPVATRSFFNVLWSNVQVLKPSLYSRMPKIVVERRFKDSDPAGRLAAQIAERATSFCLMSQQDRFNYSVKSAVEDRLLPGRGQVWLRYEAEFIEPKDEDGNPVLDESGNPVQEMKPNSEMVYVDYVHWQDYFEAASRNPFETKWRAKRVYMTRAELIKRFGEKGKLVELNHAPSGTNKKKLTDEERNFLLQAEVFEIEDRANKQRVWVSKGYDKGPLDIKPDMLNLNGFFSSPYPLLATTTTDSQYPTADYKIYERLADELDYVLKRISALVECIRFVGATAASFTKDVKNILKLSDGQLWPIENWAQWTEKGGFEGAMDWLPFDKAVAAIGPLQEHADTLLQQINMITGIPDIVQGASDPTETLGSQQLKSHWTVVKITQSQADVQRFCREIISKVAEIIFEPGLFSDDTIGLMCGVNQLSPEDQANYPQALALLRDDRLRTFRVDIETDSTIAVDEDQDKAARMEYIQAINNLMGNVPAIKETAPEFLEATVESALFATRAFRTGRPLEGAWEKAGKVVIENQKAAEANPPPPPPDYQAQQLQILQADSQTKQMEVQVKAQNSQAELQFNQWLESQKLQLETQKQQMDFELESQKIQIQGMSVQSKAEADKMDKELKAFQAQFSQFIETQTLELEKYRVVLDEKEKFLEEARLAAQERTDAKEASMGEGGKRGGPVNIHLNTDKPIVMPQPEKPKRKIHKTIKTPDGYVTETMEIPEPEVIK